MVDGDGKAQLFDGRSGEPFPGPDRVGYVLPKLHHLVDDKIHARSTGPYSMITQQPLGGKASSAASASARWRWGARGLWGRLRAAGAAHDQVDDIVGRVKVYEAIVKGDNIPSRHPESFKVLVKEMQSLCLDVEVLSSAGEIVDIKDTEEDFRVSEELGVNLSRPERITADEL